MTKDEAIKLGYTLIKASAYEVGLLKNNKGVRTWWASDFNGIMPELDNPIILASIKANETI